MTYIQDIANSIHPSIRVTIDYPTKHANGRLPVLDLEQWIEEIDVNDIKKPQILHSHYMKPMSNKGVIHRNSALTMRTKQASRHNIFLGQQDFEIDLILDNQMQ